MNEYYSKLAGEADALSAFGLAHGTPRPPPTWAQGWLEGARKSGTKNLTIPSMSEKRAFIGTALLGGMGLKALAGTALGKALVGGGIGAGLHVGSNVLQKGLKRFAPQLGEKQFASGLAHGLEGKKMHPIMESAIRLGAGPEYLAQYQMGQLAAKQTAGMTPLQRDAYLRHAGGALGESKYLSKAPIIGDVAGGVARQQRGEHGFIHKHLLKTVPENAETPRWQKAVAPLAAVGASVAAPHLAPQFLVNAARDRLSKSDYGRAFMARQAAMGGRGEAPSKLKRGLTDLFLSPAVNAPRDIGLAANKEYTHHQNRLNQWAAEHGHQPLPLPGAGDVTNFAEGVYNRLKTKPLPDVTKAQAQPGTNGALTKALLAGGGLYALNKATQDDDERARA